MTRVLGIETSCDETGIAIVENGHAVLASEVASQIEVHAKFGGVVPEIASRRHTECISYIAQKVFGDVDERDGDEAPVDAVAVTIGPGLMGSLLVGVSFAKAVAYAWRVPFVPVHHIEGHIYSAFLNHGPPEFPFLSLIVSGGHTCLAWTQKPHKYEILGSTRDDAVGESFDKVARLLGLPYPGGPSIQKAAEGGDPNAVDFPRGMKKRDSLDFSYSGLKTAVLYKLREDEGISTADIAASFQNAAIDVLLIKTKRAVQQTGAKRLVLAGGVAANTLLRDRLKAELGIEILMPPIDLCIDNGVMIAAAGYYRLERGLVGDLDAVPTPNLPLK